MDPVESSPGLRPSPAPAAGAPHSGCGGRLSGIGWPWHPERTGRERRWFASLVIVRSAETRTSRYCRPRVAGECSHAARVDVAADKVGFPDGDEGDRPPAQVVAVKQNGIGGRRHPVEGCSFLPGPVKARRCAGRGEREGFAVAEGDPAGREREIAGDSHGGIADGLPLFARRSGPRGGLIQQRASGERQQEKAKSHS